MQQNFENKRRSPTIQIVACDPNRKAHAANFLLVLGNLRPLTAKDVAEAERRGLRYHAMERRVDDELDLILAVSTSHESATWLSI